MFNGFYSVPDKEFGTELYFDDIVEVGQKIYENW